MFLARSTELKGSLVVGAPVDAAFELFSPLGEKLWVPGWDPELIYPPGSSWEPGLIFRTREGQREAIWVVTTLDRSVYEVEYHRFEADRYLVRVRVACSARSAWETDVRVTYVFVGLSESGSREITLMTAEAHAERMSRWQDWISQHFGRQGLEDPKQG